MKSVPSVDEIVDSFLISAEAGELAEVPLGRSQSEWALYRVLEEVSSSSSAPKRLEEVASHVLGDGRLDRSVTVAPPIDPEECHAFLKSRLDVACAAFARSRESSVNARDSVFFSESQPQVLMPRHLNSPSDGSFLGASVTQSSASNGPLIPMMAPIVQRNLDVQVKQPTNESSGEDSDDDELEGDTGTTENKDPVEEKRMRRMQSNRESARRSRRRKQDNMTELETQVGQLKVEHMTLLKRLTDMNHQFDEASVDNRILKADIETLRVKVKMAEETVKHATGINPLLLAMSNLSSTDDPFVNSPINSFPAAAVSPNINNSHFFPPVGPHISNGMNSQHPILDNNFPSTDPTLIAGNIHNGAAGISGIPRTIPGWNNSVPKPPHHSNFKHK